MQSTPLPSGTRSLYGGRRVPKGNSVPRYPAFAKVGSEKKSGWKKQDLKIRIRSTRIRGNLCTVNFLVLRVFCRHRSHT